MMPTHPHKHSQQSHLPHPWRRDRACLPDLVNPEEDLEWAKPHSLRSLSDLNDPILGAKRDAHTVHGDAPALAMFIYLVIDI